MSQLREQAARVAKLEAFEHSAPDCETLATEIIEANTPRHDVAPGHPRGQRKTSLTYERFDVLELDQRHLIVCGATALRNGVTITPEPLIHESLDRCH